MSFFRSFAFAACQTSALFIISLVHVNILFAQAEGQFRNPHFPPPPDDWREIAEEVANSGDDQADPDDGGFPGAVLELMGTGPQLSGFNEQSKLLALNKRIVESNSYSHWQESVYDEGNFRVMLPGAGKCLTIDQPTPFGPSRLYCCEYTMTLADENTAISIRACSAHEPAKFLTKYTAQERIALINKMFERHYQSKLPDFDHPVQKTAGQILGKRTERIQSTARRGNDWSINHSAMVYVDDIRYHIQVTQHGNGVGTLLPDEDIEKIFSSFQLLK